MALPAIVAGVTRAGAALTRLGRTAATSAKTGAKQGVENAAKAMAFQVTHGAMTNTMQNRQNPNPDDFYTYYPR